MRRLWRVIRNVILLALVFAAGAVAVFTLTDRGRENLAGIASSLASSPGQSIRISGIDGLWSGPLSVRRVVIEDGQGPWLAINDVRVSLSWLSLLSKRIEADFLRVGRVEIARLPEPAEEAQPSSGEFALPVDIDIEAIDVAEIALGEALAGEVATLSAKSRLVAIASPLKVDVQAAVERIDGRGGSLDLGVVFAPDENRLDVDVKGAEPAGGVIANLLRLPGAPPVSIAANGSGPAADWRGEAAFAVDGNVVTRLNGRHQFVEGGSRIEAKGTGDFARFMPEGFRAIAQGSTAIDFAGSFLEGGAVSIEHAALDSETVEATVGGRLDPGGDSDLNLRANAKGEPVELRFGEGDGAVSADLRSLEATISGPQGKPAVDAAVGLATVETTQGTLTDIGVDITSPGIDLATRTGPVSVHASIGSFETPIAALAPLVAGQLAIAAEGELGENTLTITSSSIRGDVVSATANGEVSMADGALAIDVDADAAASALPAGARGVLGDRVVLAGRIERDADGRLDVSGLDLKSGPLAVNGSAALADGEVTAALEGAVSDLARLAESVAGGATFSLSAQGPMTTPSLDVQLKSDRIESGGRAITDLVLSAKGTVDAANPAADIELSGAVEGQELAGSARLATRGGVREIAGLSLSLGENRITGDLTLDDSFLPVGTVDLNLPDLGPLGALALQQVTGAAQGRVTFSNGAEGPSAAVALDIASFQRDTLSGQDISIEATVADYLQAPAVSGNVRAAAIKAGETAVTGMDVGLTRDGAWTGFDGKATVGDIPAEAAGRAKYENGVATVELDGGKATVRGVAASVARKSTVVYADGVARIEELTLALSGGAARISGTAGETLDLDVALSDVPASLANSFSPGLGAGGTVSGTVAISGAADDPSVRFDLDLAGARTSQTTDAGFGPMAIDANGTFASGNLRFDASVGDGSGLTMRGGGTVATAGSRALNLDFRGAVPFNFLTRRLAQQGLSLTGVANVALSVGGTTASPSIGGTVTSSGARFVDARSGIAINDLNANISLGNGVATITSMTGTMSTGGSLTASGTVGIDAGQGFPADIAIKIANGRYADGRVVTANFSGDVAVKGPLVSAPVLSGQISLGRTVVTLPETLPGSLTNLNVKHRNASAEVMAQAEALRPAEAGGGGGGLSLDLNVDAPRQLFVQGRGVDAELGGSIRLTGPASAPQATGLFTLRRGRLTVLDRRLDFSSGSLDFAGSLVPRLDFAATSSMSESTVTITVTGPATDPKFAFTSVPAAPEDEALAQLIFGRSLSNLSPLQIAQLASAAAQLAGVGGSTSLLDRLRAKIGVDDIDVKTDAKTGDTSVSVGKYLNDRTYVTIEKGSQPGSGKAAINLEVGKGVKLRGEAADDGSTKGGIFYEREY